MYIVIIGWMYVVTLMAATETNFVAGVVTFLFYGAFPCGVLAYLMGTKSRRIKRLAREEAELASQNGQMEPPDAAPADEKTSGNP
ncbi:hypothetical protein NSP04_12910 [Limnobacter sp. YS8-69]|uniref:Transmembrane protein n=1 Tax=Limnobacter parvus TaxID=2939690 RepID=A0ABT1XL04_9BURK|nr:hypothetical protein [Limnobacter parvus]